MGWCGLVWAGVGWRGLVWAGVGWCGLVWAGVPGGPEGPGAYLGHETAVLDSRHMKNRAGLADPP